ncbi:CCHC-type domain-containing protein [Trichonephila clavipes]|nr:CCHC-type domain-containing protein [Trichonephila clavipes]
MPSPAFRRSTQSYIQSVLGLCQEVNPLMKEDEKVSHLMKGVAEDIYQAPVDERNQRHSKFYQMVQLYRRYEAEEMSTKPTETRPRPTYAAVTRKYRAPVQKFPPEPRKTDVWRTADNRPVCFHCGRPGQCATAERERLSLTTLETADGTSTTLALKKKYADQTPLAVLRQVPREADPQYVVTDLRRHIADPVSHQAVGARKTKESDLPRRITVSGYQTRGDINVLDGSKHLLFEKNIATPSMVSTYRNGKVMSGLPTCSSKTKSSLEECA